MPYEKRYGQWAGNERGRAPNFDNCCATVWKGHLSHQCGRAKFKDDYCSQHHPDRVAEKREAASRRYAMNEYHRKRMELRGADDVLRLIADGHNDPRAVAKEWLAKFAPKIPPPPKPPVM